MAVRQQFLTWVQSSPRGLMSQLQGLGCLVHPTSALAKIFHLDVMGVANVGFVTNMYRNFSLHGIFV